MAVLCPKGHPVRKLPSAQIFDQRPFDARGALVDAIRVARPTVIIPGDERSLYAIHRLHKTGSDRQREIISQSLGGPAGYAVTASRSRLLEVAKELGVATPDSAAVQDIAALNRWMDGVPRPWVLKAEHSWGGMGVRVVETVAEAHRAFNELRDQPTIMSALKRSVVNQDSYWLADRLTGRPPRITVQTHVRGRPGDLAMFCENGKVMAVTMAELVASASENGPATLVRLVEREDFMFAATAIAKKLQLSGFYGLDFMIEDRTNQALLLELNPRPTALSNIRNAANDPISAAIHASSGCNPAPCPVIPLGSVVACFPNAWASSHRNPHFADAAQDVPWNEPALMEEMLLERWPDRRPLARCIAGSRHLVRRMKGASRSLAK